MTLATLSTFATATADANGAATVTIGPNNPREVWAPTRVQCSSTPQTATTRPVATVYLGAEGGTRLGATASAGTTGDAIGPAIRLFSGQLLTVVFSGCDAGATARVDVTGTRTLS
jgi:hypothetical protein